MILGATLEETGHGDHSNTIKIIEKTRTLSNMIQFFGYIPLGNRSNDKRYSPAEIGTRADSWKKMGVNGIFVDEFGYEYQPETDSRPVRRARQNGAIDQIHGLHRGTQAGLR